MLPICSDVCCMDKTGNGVIVECHGQGGCVKEVVDLGALHSKEVYPVATIHSHCGAWLIHASACIFA